MKALTIRQPWTWLIVHGHKDIENRTWRTAYRGPVLIHAATRLAGMDSYAAAVALCDRLGITLPDFVTVGAVIGIARITGCVQVHPSPWFSGPYGFVLEDAHPVEPFDLRGRLGLFNVSEKAIPPAIWNSF